MASSNLFSEDAAFYGCASTRPYFGGMDCMDNNNANGWINNANGGWSDSSSGSYSPSSLSRSSSFNSMSSSDASTAPLPPHPFKNPCWGLPSSSSQLPRHLPSQLLPASSPSASCNANANDWSGSPSSSLSRSSSFGGSMSSSDNAYNACTAPLPPNPFKNPCCWGLPSQLPQLPRDMLPSSTIPAASSPYVFDAKLTPPLVPVHTYMLWSGSSIWSS